MGITETNDFRTKYQNFLKWTKYMKEKMKKIDIDKFKEKWIPKFLKDVCEPFDNAWNKLSEDERETFFPSDTSIGSVKEKRARAAQRVYEEGIEDVPF